MSFSKKVRLEKVVEEALRVDRRKDWKWFGACMTLEPQSGGLSWRYSKDGAKDWVRIGEMQEGKLHGWGIHVFLDGRKLVLGRSSAGSTTTRDTTSHAALGTFHEATVLWENGAKYVGELDNVKNGWGIMTWMDGNRYEGHWKNDKREGKGTLIWANGTKYEGDWKNSKIEGHGVHTLPNGDTLTGEWKNGKAHGQCKMIWNVANYEYEGNWINGEPEVDQDICLHPSLRECLRQNTCSGRVTGATDNYGQFFYRCKGCNLNYCISCWDSCHINHTGCFGIRKWALGIHCHCAHNLQQCCKSGEVIDRRPSKKVKLC